MIIFVTKFNFAIFSVGSVLLQDEAHNSKGDFSKDVSISIDGSNHHRYQQQLQLIDEQVNFLLVWQITSRRKLIDTLARES